MELRQLRYFLKAKECMNFTEAADLLFISQSTLSQQIKQLEIELGIPLFNRIGKRIALTEAGEVFSVYAQKSLEQSNQGFLAIQDLKGLESGNLHIGVSYGLRNTLLPAIKKFIKNYPSIKLQITLETTEILIQELEQLKLDLILFYTDDSIEPQFESRYLFTSQMCLATSIKNQHLLKKQITLQEVLQLPLAMPSKGFYSTKLMMKAFEEQGLHPNVLIEINDIPALIELVKEGDLHSIMTNTTIANEPDLLAVPFKGKHMKRDAVILTQKDVYITNAMREFIIILEQINY